MARQVFYYVTILESFENPFTHEQEPLPDVEYRFLTYAEAYEHVCGEFFDRGITSVGKSEWSTRVDAAVFTPDAWRFSAHNIVIHIRER